MKIKSFLAMSAAGFLLAFPIGYVIQKPIRMWIIPDGVMLRALSVSDPMDATMMFSLALAITLAVLPISALVLRRHCWKLVAVLASALFVGCITGWALRLKLHAAMATLSKHFPAYSLELTMKQLHLERIPIASLIAIVISTAAIKLSGKASPVE